MKFLLASLKTFILILKVVPKVASMLFRFSFALIGKFFLVYIHNRIQEQFLESRTTFKGTGGYQKAGTSSLKTFTGRNFRISVFIEASRNFILDFLHKRQLKIVKSAHSKSTVSNFRTFKKNSSHDTIPLNKIGKFGWRNFSKPILKRKSTIKLHLYWKIRELTN